MASGPTLPPSDRGSETERVLPDREPATRPNPVQPSYVPPSYVPPSYVPPRQPATVVRPGAEGAGVVRYGPGVPVSQAGVAAESVWRTGQRPGSAPRPVRWRRVRAILGLVVTVVLLAAAGVVVWLRLFDHPALAVTGVKITGLAKTGCEVDLTGRIATNGSAGTVSYQWVFQPQSQAPQPLNQSVTAGQHAVYVTVAVQGQGHGTATQTATLDVLGPDSGSASTTVTISC